MKMKATNHRESDKDSQIASKVVGHGAYCTDGDFIYP
jgi:hypothetical protein